MHIFLRNHKAAPAAPELAAVVHRNIHALSEVRAREEQRKTRYDRIADAVTRFAGNLWWIGVHVLMFAAWFVVNAGWVPHVRPFDPYPFALLSTITCVEGIFLASFILVSANRAQRLADRRAELNLQIALLTEHELTHVVHLVDALAKRFGVERPDEASMADIKKAVDPEQVVEEITRAEEAREAAGEP